MAGRGEHGFLTVQFLVATGLSLLLVVALANLVVFSYGRGAVRAALDEGVRAGSRMGSDPTGACAERVRAVLADLLGGWLGDEVGFGGCRLEHGVVVADAAVSFQGWVPMVPTWTFEISARAVAEQAP